MTLRIRHIMASAGRCPGFWAFVLAISFFAVNLKTLGHYGMSFDEPNGMKRGQQTVAFIARMIVPSASDQNVVIGGFHSHPTFYATCNYLLSEFLIQYGGWERIAAGHFLNVLTASLGLVMLFYLGKSMFNEIVGLVAVVFMVFFPRFVAHAHYNAKDIPVMVFAVLTLLCLCLGVKHRSAKYWVLAGLSFAWSVTSKLDGLFLSVIFFAAWALWRFSEPSDAWRSELRCIGLFLYSAMIFVFLFWPALWLDPFHLFRAVSEFAGQFNNFSISYLGQDFPIDRVPWHYMPVHLLAVAPVASLFFVALGAIWSLRHLSRKYSIFEHTLLWCWLLIPLLARMKPGALQYDGMRHVFLVVPALALLAGFGVDQLRTHWIGRTRIVFPSVGLCCGLLAWLSWQTVQIHPYQGSYLNEGVRLFIRGPKLGDYFDFYSWGTLLKEGSDWLDSHAPAHFAVAVPNNLPTLQYYALRNDLQFQKTDDADFIMMMGWRKDLRERFDSAPLFSVRCYGADLLLIYARRNE